MLGTGGNPKEIHSLGRARVHFLHNRQMGGKKSGYIWPGQDPELGGLGSSQRSWTANLSTQTRKKRDCFKHPDHSHAVCTKHSLLSPHSPG